jgi:hypothetical protein
MVGGVVQATTTCHQAMANRRPTGAERIASRTARATWGWQDAEWARYAGFGRRERRRRRCGGNGGHQASAASHPSGVNRGLLGRTRPRRGQRLFTCKRRDAREASLPLRCYAESREGPGLHRQPRPGDRRCVGRPPSASANAGLRRLNPTYAGRTHPGTCLEPGQQVWGAQFTGQRPVPHRRAGRQGRLWHCVSTDSITQEWRKARSRGDGVAGWRSLAAAGGEREEAVSFQLSAVSPCRRGRPSVWCPGPLRLGVRRPTDTSSRSTPRADQYP